jgi:glycosyltransferase involved in cell wall biosynthesis
MPTAETEPGVLAAIPCYNEARFIGDIVARVKGFVPQVLVIDDGSSDGTADVARRAGADVIRHEANKGVGEATRTAFREALARDVDVLVTLDGDGQHAPEDLPAVLGPVLQEGADVVIGSRFLYPGYKVPTYRKFGIDVITWLLNLGSRTRVSDAQSGYRAYSRRAIRGLDATEKGFGSSVQLLIQARRLGLRIAEAPVSCIYHDDGSTINPVRHGLGVALTVVRLRLKDMLFHPRGTRP